MTDAIGDGYALRLGEAELQRYRLMAEHARASEADLWQTAGLAEGAAVADVGCGPGALFPALVEAVGAAGRLVGVDGDPAAVEAARALVAANGWSNVTVRIGAADGTGLEPGSFDLVMMRHVLAHNGSAEQAIVDHLATLVRPGGCVYLVDGLASGFTLRPDDPEVAELSDAYLRFHAAKGNDLRTGTRLDLLLGNAGLELLAYRGWYNIASPPGQIRPPAWAAREAMVAAGFATEQDVERWGVALERLSAQSPMIFAALFGAVARRPTS